MYRIYSIRRRHQINATTELKLTCTLHFLINAAPELMPYQINAAALNEQWNFGTFKIAKKTQ